MLFDGPESADCLITAVPLHNETKRIATILPAGAAMQASKLPLYPEPVMFN